LGIFCTMRTPLLLAILVAANGALAADPRMVTPPEQTPAPRVPAAPAPEPRPSTAPIQRLAEPANPTTPQLPTGKAGTEQSPLVVRVLPTPKTADEAEIETKERDARATAEQGLATYTGYLWLATCALAFVAVVQAGLFVWQLVLLNRSVRDAKTAANAANASAEAAKLQAYAAQQMLVLAQRPKLRVRNVVVKYPVPTYRQPFKLFEPGQPVSDQFYIVNTGGTVARIAEGDCRVYWTKQDLPMERPYEGNVIETMIPRVKLEAGESLPITFQSRQAMGPEGDDIRTSAAGWRLYVMGWIQYTDDLNNQRRTAFCREYRSVHTGTRGRFFPVADPDYEHEE